MCNNFPNDVNRTLQDISKSLHSISKYYLSLLEKERNGIEKRTLVWTEEKRLNFRNTIGKEI